MSDPFRTSEDYELFIYNLPGQFQCIRQSTLTFIRLGSSLGRVAGDLEFDLGLRLTVRERLLFARLPLVIDWYGYEVWKSDEKIFWYDPQPHPNEAALQLNHPHHKHVHPGIKHNRIPAPQMSFHRPNLSTVTEEIEGLLATNILT